MIWTQESAALLARVYRYGLTAETLGNWIAPRLQAHARVCDVGRWMRWESPMRAGNACCIFLQKIFRR